MLFDSIGVIGQTLIAGFIAKKDFKGLESLKTMVINFAFKLSLITLVIFILISFPLSHLFSSDPQISSWSLIGCFEVALTFPLLGYLFSTDGFFMGACDFVFLFKASVGAFIFSFITSHVVFMFLSNNLWGFLILTAVFDFSYYGFRAIANYRRFKSKKWRTYNFEMEKSDRAFQPILIILGMFIELVPA